MTDEDKLIALLQRHQSGDTSVAGEILELVDTYFRRALRPVVAKVFGTDVIGTDHNDGHCRYTEMVNDFFVKVLEKRPDAFWKAKTAAALRTWSSVVIANQMRDYLKRKKRGQQILTEISPLVAQQQASFESQYQTTFEDFLDLLAVWESSDDPALRFQADALRLIHVGGMPLGEVARQLVISDERLAKIREVASKLLRAKLG